MFNIFAKEIDFAGKKSFWKQGKVARQADGAVIATMGDTSVLCTVVASKSIKEGQDFFPLSVHYQENFTLQGVFLVVFLNVKPDHLKTKTLTSPDRPSGAPALPAGEERSPLSAPVCLTMASIRQTSWPWSVYQQPWPFPVFHSLVQSADAVSDTKRSIPFEPKHFWNGRVSIDLIVAGTMEGVLMVESEAKELPEDVMLSVLLWQAGNAFQPVIKGIISLGWTSS